MSVGFIFAFVAMASYGVIGAFNKYLLDYETQPLRMMMHLTRWAAFVLILSFFVINFWQGAPSISFPAIDWFGVSIAFVIGVIGFFGFAAFVYALSAGKAGVVVPIATSYGVITPIISYYLYGDVMNMGQMGGVAVVFAGVVLTGLSVDRDTSFFSKAALLALVSFFFWGINIAILPYALDRIGPHATSFMIEITVASFCFIVLLFRGISLEPPELPQVNLNRLYFFGGILMAVGQLSVNFALLELVPGIVSIIVSANPLICVLLTACFLGERLIARQYLGIACLVVGLMGVSYFSIA